MLMQRKMKSFVGKKADDDGDDDGDGGIFSLFAPPNNEYSVNQGIALIPIQGVIGKGLSKIEKSCGAVGVEDITAMLNTAMADNNVRGILLCINSPGGSVPGVPELADKVAAAAKIKPIFVFVDELCASAAYWIAAGATGIYATPSADVGSIGVYMPFWDVSAYYAEQGIAVELIKAGELKGTGYEGTSLDEKGRAYLQEGVDDIYKMFTGFVATYRGAELPAMQGQTFIAAKALDAKLIDQIAPDFEECFTEVKNMCDS
jgi:protease-4